MLPAVALGRETPGPSSTILKPFGLEHFSPLYRQAIDVYFTAEEAYRARDYSRARSVLHGLWDRVPPGDPAWKRLNAEAVPLQSVADFGTPPAYAALRMLTDCADWRALQRPPVPQTTFQLTVVLAGRSAVLEPSKPAEPAGRRALPVVHELDPALMGPEGERVLDESYWLFEEYVLAMTSGQVRVQRVVVPLPGLTISAELGPGQVKISRGESERALSAVPKPIAQRTDGWHLVYPSCVPQGEAYAGERFVTGGMRRGPDRSPCFVSTDLKFLRAANQNGRHVLLPIERRAALPQWLQHEFFHYLFAAYPQLRLESTSHQWHDRAAWPADFTGSLEVDYYEEALHKRLQLQTSPPLSFQFRHAPERSVPGR
jgi:hypothetical protein